MTSNMKRMAAGVGLLLMAFAMAGCRQEMPEIIAPPEEAPIEEAHESPETPELPVDSEIPADVPADPAELPESIEATFLVEGMEEAITLRLFQEENLPFHTYYPEDMIAEGVSTPDAQGVRFSANYGGIQNPDAFVTIMVYQEQAITSEEAFLAELTGDSGLLARRSYEWVEKVDPIERMHDWTLREFFFMSDENTGALYAGRVGNRFFYIDIHYPWEYGDGMEARAYLILEQFTWTDTGQKLMP